MRSEELGSSGDFVWSCEPPGFPFGTKTIEDLFLPLRNIELVEPADNLDIVTDVLCEHLKRARQNRVVSQQVRRNEKLCVVVFAFEHERHWPVPIATVSGEQQRIRLTFSISAAASSVKEPDNGVSGATAGDDISINVAAFSIREDFRLTVWLSLCRRD